ncbi:MAG: PLP-dependent aminotransferase family protein [Deltaproteobacteria bacterium]|nr:PLP-dependent aminotransferase family protein [Deltaproteobacteria bacterium]
MAEISFLRGVPAQDALEAVAGAVENNYAKAMREYGAKLLQYQIPGLSDFNGFMPLKKSLAERYGIGGDPNRRIICFNGGLEALSFVLKAFPRGSQVAMESMTYDRALADALRYEHEVLGIPLTKEGVDLAALERTLSGGKVRLFYRVIYHQNPTGLDSTQENIEEAGRICARHNTLYVCDIAYYELRYDGGQNRLPDMAANPAICLLGSFTKTLTAGAKCGFGIFPEKVTEQLAPVIANTRINPNYPTQAMIQKMIESSEYDEYLRFLAKLYRPRMDAFNRSLRKYLEGIEVPQVTGGFFSGIWLPGIMDEEGFVKAVRAKGANIAVANVFCPGWKERLRKIHQGSFFRLTFPALKPEEIEQGIERIGAAYREMR